MRDIPMGMPTKEEEARRANDWDAVTEAMHLGKIDARPGTRIAAGLLVAFPTAAILAAGFLTWVWFIAECVKLATRWGWLP